MHQNTGTLEAPNFCTNHEERQCSLLFRGTSNCISKIVPVILQSFVVTQVAPVNFSNCQA